MQVPGGHHRHGELHDLRGLKTDAEIEPALRALADVAGDENEYEQKQPRQVAPWRPAPHQVRRQLRSDQHCDERDEQADDLLQPEIHVLAHGRIQHHEPEPADQQDAAEQGAIEIKPLQQVANAAQGCRAACEQTLRVAKAHRHPHPGTGPSPRVRSARRRDCRWNRSRRRLPPRSADRRAVRTR